MQAPYPLAMVICDEIHTDPASRKHFLLGTFSAIYARSFPAKHAQLCMFVAITDGRGKIPLKLLLVDAEEKQPPIFEGQGDIEFRDPRMIMEFVFKLQGVEFPGPGEYRFQLYAGDQFLMERRILVQHLPKEPR